MLFQILLIVLLGYLLGSIPTSILIGRVVYKRDIRQYGSGNAGGTNVWRVFGWKAGLFVMAFDVTKGLVATLFVPQLFMPPDIAREVLQLIAGSSAVIGHIWTIFAGFKGGKGVGTAAGMLIGLYPVAILVCLGIFGFVIVMTGIVSAGSLSAAFALPIVLWIMNSTGWRAIHPALFYFSIPIVILIFFTHRSNIHRLLRGEENRFNKLRIFSRDRE